MGKTMRAIGLMSGTSMDGIDVAMIDTDGESRLERGPALTIALSLTVFVLIGWSFWRMAGESRLAVIGIGLLAGGGIGNMIDRLRHGAVIDFVAVGPWPRFNVADSAITIGVLLLAWSVLTAQEQTPDDPTKEHSPHAATGSEQIPH